MSNLELLHVHRTAWFTLLCFFVAAHSRAGFARLLRAVGSDAASAVLLTCVPVASLYTCSYMNRLSRANELLAERMQVRSCVGALPSAMSSLLAELHTSYSSTHVGTAITESFWQKHQQGTHWQQAHENISDGSDLRDLTWPGGHLHKVAAGLEGCVMRHGQDLAGRSARAARQLLQQRRDARLVELIERRIHLVQEQQLLASPCMRSLPTPK